MIYVIISIVIVLIGIVITTLYNKLYKVKINQILKQKRRQKVLQPSTVFVIYIATIIVVSVLINFFPIIKIEETPINSENDTLYELNLENEYVPEKFYDYDINYNTDGMYIVSSSIRDYYSGAVNEESEQELQFQSYVRLYNQSDDVVWETGDYYELDFELEYLNHLLGVKSVTFINDGNIALFGISFNRGDSTVYQTVVIIDIEGNLVDLIDIDISEYGFDTWGFGSYDIIATDDGFAIMYGDSLLVTYDSDYNYKKHILITNEWNRQSTSLDTLTFYKGNFYILRVNKVVTYTSDLALVWQSEFDYDITSFDIIDDRIILSGTVKQEYFVRDGLWSLNERLYNINAIIINQLDISTGNTITERQCQYDNFAQLEPYVVDTHYTIVDEKGDFYIIAHNNPKESNTSDSLMYLLIQYDKDFKYVGFDTINIDGFADDKLENVRHKSSIFIDDGDLKLNNVLSGKRVIVYLDELEFTQDRLEINIDMYNFLLKSRVLLTNVSLLLLLEFILILLPLYYKYISGDYVYVDYDELRNRYNKL